MKGVGSETDWAGVRELAKALQLEFANMGSGQKANAWSRRSAVFVIAYCMREALLSRFGDRGLQVL